MGQHRWGATDLKLGRGFGLQAEVFFRRAVDSTNGGLETAATGGSGTVRLRQLKGRFGSAAPALP